MANFNVGFSRGIDRGTRLAQQAQLLKLRKDEIKRREDLQNTQLNLQKVNAISNIMKFPAASRELAFDSLAPQLNIDLKSEKGKSLRKFVKTATEQEIDTVMQGIQLQVGEGVDISTALGKMTDPTLAPLIIQRLNETTSNQIVKETLSGIDSAGNSQQLIQAVSTIDNALASGSEYSRF